MCPINDITAAILVIGLQNGDISIYRTPLSHTQPMQFNLLKRFHAHRLSVHAVRVHPTKQLFVSGSSDCKVKIWSIRDYVLGYPYTIRDLKAPLLVKCIKHPEPTCCLDYSHCGLLLTGCCDGSIRVYGSEPLCALRWSYQLTGYGVIYSVAWSPSNRIAACFNAPVAWGVRVQVWDSTFHSIALFEHMQDHDLSSTYGMGFASDDLLVCSGGRLKTLFWYNIAKSKVTEYPFSHNVRAVTVLSSEFVCVSCVDNMLRVYAVHDDELRLLASLPHKNKSYVLGSCLYPYNNAGFVLASANFAASRDVCISVTSRFNNPWVQEVTKIMLNSSILPFCTDVNKIILKYYGL